MNNSFLYKDKPIFGLDIGTTSVKVMQLTPPKNKVNERIVQGYGLAHYEKSAFNKGVIKEPEVVAKAINKLFEKSLVGTINTRRVAMSLPVANTYNRVLSLPVINKKELAQAVRLEAEQYIPVASEELYIDYTIISNTKDNQEVLISAVPKKIVDSYIELTNLLGIELVSLETTIAAAERLVSFSEENQAPTILIDFGSLSVDISIYDRRLVVTGTVSGGGDTFTQILAHNLQISEQVAYTIKSKYGLNVSKKQTEIKQALEPTLNSITKEIKKMIRYYEDRSKNNKHVEQIITLGGGSNLPGLSDYLTYTLRLPVRMSNPWVKNLVFNNLQPPSVLEQSMYITVAGLALLDEKRVWDD